MSEPDKCTHCGRKFGWHWDDCAMLQRKQGPLVLEHDPDLGCAGCPLADLDPAVRLFACQAVDESSVVTAYEPAPDRCPLRAAPVLVRVPERQSGD